MKKIFQRHENSNDRVNQRKKLPRIYSYSSQMQSSNKSCLHKTKVHLIVL
jgi:hypothetical protein